MSAIYWNFTWINIDVCSANSNEPSKINEYELRWIIKDKSGQKDENTGRQNDNTQAWEGFQPNFNERGWTNMNYKRLTRTKRQIDKKAERWGDYCLCLCVTHGAMGDYMSAWVEDLPRRLPVACSPFCSNWASELSATQLFLLLSYDSKGAWSVSSTI